MIKLNIGYDPGLPFGSMQGPQDDPLFDAPEPRFPLRGNTVSVLGLRLTHEHLNSRGFDPYAGECWTLKIGEAHGRLGELKLTISDLICATVEVQWIKYGDDWRMLRVPAGHRVLHRSCEVEWEKMPRIWRKLWDFLKYRLLWWQYNSPKEDDYHSYA